MPTLATRYLVLARVNPNPGTEDFHVSNAGDDLPAAQQAYLDAIARSGTIDVHLVERVPVILHDGRGAKGRMAVLAEKLGWCQQRMLEAGLTAADVARRGNIRISEDTILKMLSGEEIKARHVDELVGAVRLLTRHLDTVPAATDGEG